MNSSMINNAPMVDNGHFGDEDVVVLVSIVVCCGKGERVLLVGPVAGRTHLCSP